MHFFYLDETGCSGNNLHDNQEPIFVLGGISVKDQGWVKTYKSYNKILTDYFDVPELPDSFELHANELLSPDGEGAFLGHTREKRNKLTKDILKLLKTRKHKVHFIAIDKEKLHDNVTGSETDNFNPREPYLLSYDYLISYIEQYTKKCLGTTARSMLIIDVKDQYQHNIEKITHVRRFELPKTKRLKWLVEFSYPVDSEKHPMIQFSDLVIFCVRKFLEMEAGYRDAWPNEAKKFYQECFAIISERQQWTTLKLVDNSRSMRELNQLLQNVSVFPLRGWKNRYT